VLLEIGVAQFSFFETAQLPQHFVKKNLSANASQMQCVPLFFDLRDEPERQGK
jgi:hypothetical protein